MAAGWVQSSVIRPVIISIAISLSVVARFAQTNTDPIPRGAVRETDKLIGLDFSDQETD
jgi:hypothetical protein